MEDEIGYSDVGLDFGDLEVSVGTDMDVRPDASGEVDYETQVYNKPSIESVTISGDRKLRDFGVGVVTNQKILSLFN